MQKNFAITETNIKEVERTITEEMDKAIKHFERELITIRTGRAHPALVEGVKVTCYGGTVLPLKEVASITAPEAKLIVIQPWDINIIADIERAIATSDLGVTPANDGNLIRIRLPDISGTRREELQRILGKKLEECRVSIRNVRKDFHNMIREAQKNKAVSEDHAHRLTDLLQKITDKFILLADQMGNKKEQEITSV